MFYAGIRLGGIPLWNLIVHDWTKFTTTEWVPYVNWFHGPNAYKPSKGSTGYLHKPGDDIAFDEAWRHHWTSNPHHWQYWLKYDDDGTQRANWMMKIYAREMIADWYGAGMAQGKPDIDAWYLANKDNIKLHDDTRYYVTQVIREAKQKGIIP